VTGFLDENTALGNSVSSKNREMGLKGIKIRSKPGKSGKWGVYKIWRFIK